MFQPVRLTVTPESTQIQPGSRQVVVLTVQNATAIVDRFQIAVSGLGAGWYSLDAPVLSLFPGARGQATLTLQPPTGTGTAAGEYPVTIQVTSEDDPKLQTSLVVMLTVSAVGQLGMELAPASQLGREGNYRVTFLNQTNGLASVTLQARDDEQKLDYRMQPDDTVSVPAGGQSTIAVRVTPQVRETIGEPHPYQIEFRGVPSGTSSTAAPSALLVRQASFTYQPRLSALAVPVWLRRLPGWALVLLLLALLLLVFFAGNRTSALIAGSPSATAVPTATQSGGTGSLFSPTPAVPWTPVPTETTGVISTPLPLVTPTLAPLPKINNFGVQVGPKGALGLGWSVTGNPKSVQIDGKTVAPNGQLPLQLTGHRTIILSASSAGGTVSQILQVAPPPRATVAVVLSPVKPQLPVIRFTTRPDPATGVLDLVWQVTGADSTTLNNKPVPSSGSQPLAAGSASSFVMAATNALGTATSKLVLPNPPTPQVSHVVIRQPVVHFTLQHPGTGQPYTLQWQTTDATQVTLNGQPVSTSGAKPLPAPVQNGVYTLVAKNNDGQQTQAQVQVQVQTGA